MPTETVYADLVLAVAALIAGVLYLRARRRPGKRKTSAPRGPPAPPAPAAAPPPPAPAGGPGPPRGPPWSRRAGRTAGPHMGLTRARSWHVSATSATVMGCAEAGSATRAGRAVLGQ